ncbi:hypothetical protein EGR_10042 [Echinococcus granulosus]|uniref:Uncharacterized protein n=1 Tax=Echinococcus granulosus TaxID=6210 RepID=W6U1X5_ECHGR|nr:hypothetical protein EGR_10042 [Echinococcus granulosus]EUB55105.1 hypothetical protein EGR_10042 [Echinococcus granulosus]
MPSRIRPLSSILFDRVDKCKAELSAKTLNKFSYITNCLLQTNAFLPIAFVFIINQMKAGQTSHCQVFLKTASQSKPIDLDKLTPKSLNVGVRNILDLESTEDGETFCHCIAKPKMCSNFMLFKLKFDVTCCVFRKRLCEFYEIFVGQIPGDCYVEVPIITSFKLNLGGIGLRRTKKCPKLFIVR